MEKEQRSSPLGYEHIGKILHVDGMIPLSDREFGDGYSVSIGENDRRMSLQVFPEESAVRAFMGTASLEIGPVTDIAEHDGKLRLASAGENETSVLEVSPTGTVVFSRTPGV